MASNPPGAPGSGQLYVISAPSGAGKTTLVKRLVALHPELRFSISYTTRPKRTGEVHGKDYFFVDEAEFARMQANGEFLEYANVFGNLYGTGRNQVETLLANGEDVLLEIDWQGARQVRANLPACRSIFILPPSVTELERRLRGRSTDSDAVIARRLGEAVDDIAHWREFDFAVVNDNLDAAVGSLQAILAGAGQDSDTTRPAVRARARAVLASSK